MSVEEQLLSMTHSRLYPAFTSILGPLTCEGSQNSPGGPTSDRSRSTLLQNSAKHPNPRLLPSRTILLPSIQLPKLVCFRQPLLQSLISAYTPPMRRACTTGHSSACASTAASQTYTSLSPYFLRMSSVCVW